MGVDGKDRVSGRVRLIHWNAAESEPLLKSLRAAGYQVDYEERVDYHLGPVLKANPPAAVVIDLSRKPSHGREVATFLRGNKATRFVPIVFVGGEPEKVEATKAKLPDAVYTPAAKLAPALKKAIASVPEDPIRPQQMMERYRTRTTVQKLGIAAGDKVAVIDPPRDYASVVGTLPEGAVFVEDSRERGAVTLWFVSDIANYHQMLPRLRPRARASKFWILWRKGGKDTGIHPQMLRERAMDVGLVDYKICSLNATWSGLLMALAQNS